MAMLGVYCRLYQHRYWSPFMRRLGCLRSLTSGAAPASSCLSNRSKYLGARLLVIRVENETLLICPHSFRPSACASFSIYLDLPAAIFCQPLGWLSSRAANAGARLREQVEARAVVINKRMQTTRTWEVRRKSWGREDVSDAVEVLFTAL
eukprot:3163993-Amphidinium_carterae.1